MINLSAFVIAVVFIRVLTGRPTAYTCQYEQKELSDSFQKWNTSVWAYDLPLFNKW